MTRVRPLRSTNPKAVDQSKILFKRMMRLQMSDICNKHNCTAVALHQNGSLVIFKELDMGSFIKNPGWMTVLNLYPRNTSLIKPTSTWDNIDFCCNLNVRSIF